jgi:hypothetical protein
MRTPQPARASILAAIVLLPALARAGGSPENAILIVDPTNPESLYVANYYREKRDIPAGNLVYLSPTPASYAQFTAATLDGFLGSLENLRLADHADYVILPSGGSFYTDAPGLVSDGCFPVGRFSATAPFALARLTAQIQGGTLDSSFTNGYYRASNEARAFDSSVQWWGGIPVAAGGQRLFIAGMLGYTGSLGNTLPEVLATIDRSVAVDGTFPAGTFYFMQTNDAARSAPRHGAFPAAVAAIVAAGGSAQHLMADLPLGQLDCLGVMTGLADPDIANPSFGLLPGAFCDHLTSYAATFDSSSQTKMSRWISKGASGTSGTVEEPCNYAGKFAHARLHVYYVQGLSLGESWYRSMGFAPFQSLFLGDPLTRPFAHIPSVDLGGVTVGPMSNTVALTPIATTTHPTAQIAGYELLIDGVSRATCGPGGHFALDTTSLADGYHEWRVLAWDDTLVKSTGRRSGAILTSNRGKGVNILVSPSSGNLTTRFDVTADTMGGAATEVRLCQGNRVVASRTGAPGPLSVYGRTLGAGTVRLQVEAEFADGSQARSIPWDVAIADASGAVSGTAPVAHAYTKRVLATEEAVVELPASFDDALAAASYAVLSNPAQAAILGGTGPYRILRPNVGASGTDTMTFQVTTPSGTSAVATVTIVYEDPLGCPTPATYCVTSPNSAGPGATMGWAGSTSVGTNDFALYAFGCPANKLGIFFHGSNPAQVPMGNGWRCIANPIHRVGIVTTDGFGQASMTLDFTLPPLNSGPDAVTVGSTRRFQLYFRDPAAGGARTNVTNGLVATFCP